MEIMELATQLGQKIKEDVRVQRMHDVTDQYEKDEALQAKIAEYNAQSQALTDAYRAPEQDREMIAAIESRIQTLYDEIVKNPVYVSYNEATEAVNTLMQEVNGEITFQITGKHPCTHDCSSCGGSCGHH